MTTTVPLDGLDLRGLARLRDDAAVLTVRLIAGDRSAIPAAKHLLEREEMFQTAARATLAALGVHDTRTCDALGQLVSEIGTGDLGWQLDVIEGRA